MKYQNLPGFYPSVAQASCEFSLGPDQGSQTLRNPRKLLSYAIYRLLYKVSSGSSKENPSF